MARGVWVSLCMFNSIALVCLVVLSWLIVPVSAVQTGNPVDANGIPYYTVDVSVPANIAIQLRDRCFPAQWYKGNEFYCDNYNGGWSSGGAGDPSGCNKMQGFFQFEDCRCDCGDGGTSCGEYRCNDDGGNLTANGCVTQDGAAWSWDKYFGCYASNYPCRRCAVGMERVGCLRTSSGSCLPCNVRDSSPNFRWTYPGVNCSFGYCSPCVPGTYETLECGAHVVNQCVPCSSYPANYFQRLYYCPGGKMKPQLCTGAYRMVDLAYSACVCEDGFYERGAQCIECEPGYFCLMGVGRSLCPVDTYSLFGASSCTACTYSGECSVGQTRVQCLTGSSRDSYCVQCAQCAIDGSTDAPFQCKNLW